MEQITLQEIEDPNGEPMVLVAEWRYTGDKWVPVSSRIETIGALKQYCSTAQAFLKG